MTSLVQPAPAGLTIRNIAHGNPDTLAIFSVSEGVSGNGIVSGIGTGYLLHGVQGNTAPDSRQTRVMAGGELTLAQIDADAVGYPWEMPWALNWRWRFYQMAAQGSFVIGFGDTGLGFVAPHTTLRTNALIRRAFLLCERDGAGVTTWYLVTCNGAAVTAFSAFAPNPVYANGLGIINPADWWTLLFRPSSGSSPGLSLRRNGTVIAASNSTLPTGGNMDQRLYGVAEWVVPIVGVGNPGVLVRLLHLSLLPFTDAAV